MLTLTPHPADEQDQRAIADSVRSQSGFIVGFATIGLICFALAGLAAWLLLQPGRSTALIVLLALAGAVCIAIGAVLGWLPALMGLWANLNNRGTKPCPSVVIRLEFQADAAWSLREQYDDPSLPRTLARVGPDQFVLLVEPPGTFGDDGQPQIPMSTRARLHLLDHGSRLEFLREVCDPDAPALILSTALHDLTSDAETTWLATARDYTPLATADLPARWRTVVAAAAPFPTATSRAAPTLAAQPAEPQPSHLTLQADAAWSLREPYDDPGVPRTLARVGPDQFLLLLEPPGTFGDDVFPLIPRNAIPMAAHAHLHLTADSGRLSLLRDASDPAAPILVLSTALQPLTGDIEAQWIANARDYTPLATADLPARWRPIVTTAAPFPLIAAPVPDPESPGTTPT
jgi:hypothetical protein